jgi:amino acid transporter
MNLDKNRQGDGLNRNQDRTQRYYKDSLTLVGAVALGAYAYVKMSNVYPSAGGIAMYLKKAYGGTVTTAFHCLLMHFFMAIAQSFLARTFGTYTLQLFDIDDSSLLVPTPGAGLLLVVFGSIYSPTA